MAEATPTASQKWARRVCKSSTFNKSAACNSSGSRPETGVSIRHGQDQIVQCLIFFNPVQGAVRHGLAGSLGQLVSFFLQVKNPLFPGHDQAIESFEFQDSFLQFRLSRAVLLLGYLRVDGQSFFFKWGSGFWSVMVDSENCSTNLTIYESVESKLHHESYHGCLRL